MDLQSAFTLPEPAGSSPAKLSFRGMSGFVRQSFVPGDGTPELLLLVACVVSDGESRAPRLW